MDIQVGASSGSRRLHSTLVPLALLAALAIALAAPAQATPNVAKAWGRNSFGQLGDGTHEGPERCQPPEEAPCSTTPVEVSTLSGVTALAGGHDHSLALLQDGTLKAWGSGEEGELGNGTTTEKSDLPVAVTELSEPTAISAAGSHSLAVRSGTVMDWGSGTFGELGDGAETNSDVPVEASGLRGALGVSGGCCHSLAVLSTGKVMAWGRNAEGQLGNGTNTKSNVPVEVTGLSTAVAVSSGETYSLALLSNGKVMAWGSNTQGQLGNGTTSNSNVPAEVTGLHEVTAIAAGTGYGLALLKNGTVMAWGANSSGQLGDGMSVGPETCGTPPTPCSKTPVPVGGLLSVSAIAAGGAHSVALLSDGRVMAWGANEDGQLGDGTSLGPEACGASFAACSTKPVEVSKVADAKGIAAGQRHSLAFGPPPTITAVKPRRAPASGGTTVTITGTDFTGTTAVKFGSTSASSFTVNSPTSITAVSPAEPAGRVDVTVMNSWGTSAISLADRFTVTPTVTGVSPNSGPAAGGTSVTVTGSGFVPGTTATGFRFGARKAASVSCSSTTTCTVVAPAHQAGTVDVKAIVNKVVSPRNRPADRFTYM